MRKLFSLWLLIAGITISINVSVLSQPYKQLEGVNLQKTQGIQIIERKLLDVNNISAYFRNDGEFYSDHATTGPGFEWPKGSGKYAIFSAGFWIGAKYRDTDTTKSIRLATVGHFGSEYRPGMIDKITGLPDDYTKPAYKVYKVRPPLDNANTNPDYLNWPVTHGAPWIDMNNDDKWDPYVDKPGLQFHNGSTFPDMMLYYVYNDANPAFHTWIWGGSKPLGVEIHKTVWAYNVLPNVHFLRFQIYNKSSRPWDSAYVGLWSDPDLGDAFDDYVGCDIGLDSRGKKHDLGYTYNGDDNDDMGYGTKPPAVGFKLLQGPLVTGNQGDTAFAFGNKITSLKNNLVSSFSAYCNPGVGGCYYQWIDEPINKSAYEILAGKKVLYAGDVRWLRGCDSTKYIFSGDPVLNTGCVNSLLVGPTDMRFIMCSGPFSLAPGDSQDVIFATLIAQGSDRLNSITKLRELSTNIRYTYDNSFQNIPFVKSASKFISSDSTCITVTTTQQNATAIKAELYRESDSLLNIFHLYDDGLHNDGSANDGVFGNSIVVYQSKIPSKLNLEIVHINGDKVILKDVETHITTAGPIKIVDFKITSDNLNADGKANPGENIRCLFGIKNLSRDTLENFNVQIFPLTEHYKVSKEQPFRNFTTTLSQNSGKFLNKENYIAFDILPDASVVKDAKIEFRITDNLMNMWRDTVAMAIHKIKFPSNEVYSNHETGEAEGAFSLRIINPELLKNHNYQISIEEIDTSKVFNLINKTTGETLLLKHPLPDEWGHNIPVTDGFKITRGTTTTQKGLKSWNYNPEKNIWFSGVKGFMADLKYFTNGLVAYPTRKNYAGIQSGLVIDSLRQVEIHFSDMNSQKAYRYIAGFQIFPSISIIHDEYRPFVNDSVGVGFYYQDFEKYRMGKIDNGYVVPFTVWEVNSKGNKLRQLDIGIVERNDTLYRWKKTSPNDSVKEYIYYGNIDGRWNPMPHRISEDRILTQREGDEVLIIFGTTYSNSENIQYTGLPGSRLNILRNFPRLPIMYVVWMKKQAVNSQFVTGDRFTITPYFFLRAGDLFSFNPAELKELIVPSNFRLTQNYPNPFNAGTTIEYGLPVAGKVRLEIYNLLGQRVVTLIDGVEQSEGNYTVSWDGRTFSGIPVSSGIYFYRLMVSGSQGSFAQTKKMIVIR